MNQYKVQKLAEIKKKKPANKKKKSKTGKVLTAGRVILLTFLSLLLSFFLAVNIFLYVYRPSQAEEDYLDLDDEFAIVIDDEGEQSPNPPADPGDKNSDCYTILILGQDVGGGNTDTMMLAMFNVKENTISVLNVPRDTYVSTKNFSGRINAVYATGYNRAVRDGTPRGEEASKAGIRYLNAMIKYTFGLEVQKYVLLDLAGFKVLVDRFGGVDFDVPFRMKYTDPYQNLYIDLQPGLQPLDGNKAEQLVRFRHGDPGYPGYGRTINGVFYPSEDIGRIQTQQRFIAALLKKMLSKIEVNTIKALFEVGEEYMVTNISIADAGWFAAKMTNVKLENIRTHTVPTNWISSVLRLEAYKAETIEIINKYYNPYKKDIPETNFNIYDKDLAGLAKPEINIDGNTMDSLVN
ncbi:MAG: LCP family protein [Oscillospiraceae bacterium]|nr:LCP family protein [Oscillospiraceae bacterium]